MKLEFSLQICEKCPNIKFHENPSSVSWIVARGRTHMTRLRAAFRKFARWPRTECTQNSRVYSCNGSYLFVVDLTTLHSFEYSRQDRHVASVFNGGVERRWTERVVTNLWQFTSSAWRNRGNPTTPKKNPVFWPRFKPGPSRILTAV